MVNALSPEKTRPVLAPLPTRRYVAKIFHDLPFLCNNCVKIVTIIKKFAKNFRQFCATTTLKFFQRLRQQKLLAQQWKLWRNFFLRNFGVTLAFDIIVFLVSQKHRNFSRHCAYLSLIFAHTKTTRVSMRAFVTFMLRTHTTAHTSNTHACYLCVRWRLLFVVVVSSVEYWDYVSGFHVNAYVFA